MTTYACRICGSPRHEVILDYGYVALADAFPNPSEDFQKEKKYPLHLVFCMECAHLQIREVLDPRLLFSHYVWETGISSTIREYCRQFADRVLKKASVPERGFIVEIASNDGTMLEEFQGRGLRVIGVDPARNIAEIAESKGISTVVDFFDKRSAENILADKGKADLIIARNVLAHVADLHGLIDGIGLLLAEQGMAVIEVPHVHNMLEQLQYDQVYHEHIGYHSLASLQRLFQMHQLQVVDCETAWVAGGSLRVYIMHQSAGGGGSDAVLNVLSQEEDTGLARLENWKEFAKKTLEQKRLFVDELSSAKERGDRVVGYGASGKGQSMIQFCGIDKSLVSYIVDKSKMKIGQLTPGSHIPIFSPEEMQRRRPDILVLFVWNLAAEVLQQESALRGAGCRFLHPIPVPHYL